jgi:hypothetical protein
VSARAEIVVEGSSLRVESVNEDGTWVVTNDHADSVQLKFFLTDSDIGRFVDMRDELRRRKMEADLAYVKAIVSPE